MNWQQKFVTFKDMLDYGKQNYPESIAMADPVKNTSIRYDELAAAVEFFSAEINAAIDTDERFTVSIFGENSMEWMLVFLSAVVGHNIVAPMNFQIKDPAEIARLIKMTKIRLIYISQQFEPLFNQVVGGWSDDSGLPAPVIIKIEDACTPVLKKYAPDLSPQQGNQPPRRRAANLRGPASEGEANARPSKKTAGPDDYAILLFTSGSINTKGVMHTQRSILSNQQAAAELLLVNHANEVFVAGLPLSHAYGLLCGFVPLYFGSTAVYAATPRQIAENITAAAAAFPERGLLTAAVPELARLMNQKIVQSVRRGAGKNATPLKQALGAVKYAMFLAMRSVNYFTSNAIGLDLSGVFFKPIKEKFGRELKMPIGGGPVDKITEFGLRGVGFLAHRGYGTTEMAPLLSANISKCNTIMDGTIGQVPPGMEVKIIDGEICGRGPNTMIGYLDNEEATKKALPGDGWYHTGDKGYYVKRGFNGRPKPSDKPADYIYTFDDKDCYLIITGRVDNQFANHRGENIFPEVIESALMKFDSVGSCRVVEKPPSNVMAQIFPDMEAIERHIGKKPSPDEVKALLSQIVKQTNAQLQNGCGIDDFEVMDSDFERNAFGKIKRKIDA